MGQPVVHFEIIGGDPAELRGYYGELFGWEFDTGDAVTEAVSQPGVRSGPHAALPAEALGLLQRGLDTLCAFKTEPPPLDGGDSK